MPAASASPPGVLRSIAIAFRQNRVPCVALNVVVAALVASYYYWPPSAGFWEALAQVKTRWSFGFSLASTAFAAAILPCAVQGLMGTLPDEGRVKRLSLMILFWGYRGMEIDLFYRVQAWIFGPGHDAATLTKKVLVDQFVMSPLWFVPTYLLALRWIDLGGSWSRTRATINRDFWFRTFPAVLATNWLVWLPTLVLVYSLPPALQFPLFSVVMCVFILLVTLLARPEEDSAAPVAQEPARRVS